MKKKFTMIIVAMVVIFSANAQNKSLSRSSISKEMSVNVNPRVLPMAVGDTLLYMPTDVYYVNATDQASFTVVTEDIDGFTTYNSGVPMDFGIYYSTSTEVDGNGIPTMNNSYHPWEDPATDSAYYWYATSWFNPAGKANNWLMFGPITLTAGGTLIWYDRNNPAFRDGYKIYATATASSPITFSDFTGSPFFTITDAPNGTSSTNAIDSLWQMRSVVIPSMYSNGQSIYIGFNHDANDMDVLRLDEITIVESGSAGIEENAVVNGVKLFQNIPNPAKGSTTIKYDLSQSSTVDMEFYDIAGKKIKEINKGQMSPGSYQIDVNTVDFSKGVYFYTLRTSNGVSSTRKMIITE